MSRRRSIGFIKFESYVGLVGMVVFLLASPFIVYYTANVGIPGTLGVSPWVAVGTLLIVGVPLSLFYAAWVLSKDAAGRDDAPDVDAAESEDV